MMRLKSLASAEATIAGIELHHMLKKGQHKHADKLSIFEHFDSYHLPKSLRQNHTLSSLSQL